MFYDGVLLFGIVMLAGLLYGMVTQQRHALQGRLGLQVLLFLLIGAYFVWFWAHGGQTLAMKTWRVRLLSHDGQPVSIRRAIARYLLAWAWFVPAMLVCLAAGWHSAGAISATLLAGVGVYALVTQLLPGRQTPHDLACGTRLRYFPG